MNKQKLKDLLAISHHYGRDPEFLLAAAADLTQDGPVARTIRKTVLSCGGQTMLK